VRVVRLPVGLTLVHHRRLGTGQRAGLGRRATRGWLGHWRVLVRVRTAVLGGGPAVQGGKAAAAAGVPVVLTVGLLPAGAAPPVLLSCSGLLLYLLCLCPLLTAVRVLRGGRLADCGRRCGDSVDPARPAAAALLHFHGLPAAAWLRRPLAVFPAATPLPIANSLSFPLFLPKPLLFALRSLPFLLPVPVPGHTLHAALPAGAPAGSLLHSHRLRRRHVSIAGTVLLRGGVGHVFFGASASAFAAATTASAFLHCVFNVFSSPAALVSPLLPATCNLGTVTAAAPRRGAVRASLLEEAPVRWLLTSTSSSDRDRCEVPKLSRLSRLSVRCLLPPLPLGWVLLSGRGATGACCCCCEGCGLGERDSWDFGVRGNPSPVVARLPGVLCRLVAEDPT
jgi:hypothetical protein